MKQDTLEGKTKTKNGKKIREETIKIKSTKIF